MPYLQEFGDLVESSSIPINDTSSIWLNSTDSSLHFL